MILATRRGDREVRLFERSADIPSWPVFSNYRSTATNYADAASMTLPTVGAAIRLISETIAAMPLNVYEGEDADKKKMPKSDQWRLLHEEPNPDQSAFDLMADIAASIEGWGNSYVRKLKVSRKLVALVMLDPAMIRVRRGEGNRKEFVVHWPDGEEVLTSAQVLHLRGFTPSGSDVGLSPIAQHRQALSSALAMQEFQTRFWQNDGTPSLFISIPDSITPDQAAETKARWAAEHGGVSNAGSVAVLGNGATLEQLTLPLKDAQFVESQEFGSDLAARIFLGPAASLLGSPKYTMTKTEEESLRFVNFCLLPRLRRIERALKADFDLFPDGASLYPEFYIEEFLRADAATRAEVQHKRIQSGLLLIDEGRAELGMGPLPNGAGQVPQLTPVGGAPNAQPAPAAPDTPPKE